MNGPGHYVEAERLQGMAATLAASVGQRMVDDKAPTDADRFVLSCEANMLAHAQVHASLALAAATAGEWLLPVATGQHAQDFRALITGQATPAEAAS